MFQHFLPFDFEFEFLLRDEVIVDPMGFVDPSLSSSVADGQLHSRISGDKVVDDGTFADPRWAHHYQRPHSIYFN